MCRNIRPLHNFAPPATDREVQDAALQFVRKLSGVTAPSKANQKVFDDAVRQIASSVRRLLDGLVTNAPPRDRDVEAARARARSAARFSARAGLRVILAVIACASVAARSASPVPQSPDRGGAIAVQTVPVALNPEDVGVTSVGRFTYAGGIAISSTQTARLHGLSDLVISGPNMVAVGDEGILFEARLVLDAGGRLSGLTDARLKPLTGLDGKPVVDKADADAEGLALLPNGDRLVSFERRHRIWLYPADGGAPRAVPSPASEFPNNGGMEALSAAPSVALDAYMAGGEESGETWVCRVSASCERGPVIRKPLEFGLVAVLPLSGARTAVLLRAWDPLRGSRVILRLQDGDAVVDEMALARPMTVDNFEGLAAVRTPDGGLRFYILSDDNASPGQRTLLLAFDWRTP